MYILYMGFFIAHRLWDSLFFKCLSLTFYTGNTGNVFEQQVPEALQLFRKLFNTTATVKTGSGTTTAFTDRDSLAPYLITKQTDTQPPRPVKLDPVLAIGGLHSGIPYHRHHESWLYLLHGVKGKRWSLFPPAVGGNSNTKNKNKNENERRRKNENRNKEKEIQSMI